MRKFEKYPIVINYNLRTQQRYQQVEDDLYRAGRREEERQRYIKTTTTSDSTLQNTLWKKELEQYEGTVYQCLRKIDGNPVGRMVLGLINKQTTVWIIPESEADLKKCYCAQTNPLNYEIQTDSVARGVGSGDTVIRFHPKLGDDTLFHELVHAYRYSQKSYKEIFIQLDEHIETRTITQKQKAEEFLAHHMENIYMSWAKRPLTLDYFWQSTADKQEIYDFLLENLDAMETLKFFLHHEYLARLVAHATIDYNPFRDYGMLEAEYLKDSSLPTLPELGTVLGV